MFTKYKSQAQNSLTPPMATIAFFILLTLTLSSTIHARESRFFNKFSTNIPNESQPSNTDQQQPSNTNQQQQPLNTNQQQQQQQQQQPEFIPQSQDSDSYGLYGHESGQLPPSATTTTNNLPDYLPENYNPVAYTTPIHSSTQYIPNEFTDPQANQYNGDTRIYNSEKQGMSDTRFSDNGRYYNGYSSQKQGFDDTRFMETENGGNMYNSEKQGMSDTRFSDNGRYYNGYNSQKQGFDDTRFMETENGGNMYNSEKQVENGRYNQGEETYRYGTSNNGNMYNTEKQGMSDTRFLENGKYYYDVNMENLNSNENMNSRGFGSRNGYNTQGYYGNNQNSYDRYSFNGGNNQNSYDRYNFNGGYQNQEYRFNP